MPVELVIATESEFDIAEAYVWYESRRAGLGEEFLSSVDACLESMRRRPEIRPIVHEGYRRSPDTSISIRRVLRAVRGDGHDLRRISYLARPEQVASAPSLISAAGTTNSERPCGLGRSMAQNIILGTASIFKRLSTGSSASPHCSHRSLRIPVAKVQTYR